MGVEAGEPDIGQPGGVDAEAEAVDLDRGVDAEARRIPVVVLPDNMR
jgi:hypothetical protein